eukprot:scaffold24602_cov24-Tisochrysis_lutea.AAC.1
MVQPWLTHTLAHEHMQVQKEDEQGDACEASSEPEAEQQGCAPAAKLDEVAEAEAAATGLEDAAEERTSGEEGGGHKVGNGDGQEVSASEAPASAAGTAEGAAGYGSTFEDQANTARSIKYALQGLCLHSTMMVYSAVHNSGRTGSPLNLMKFLSFVQQQVHV